MLHYARSKAIRHASPDKFDSFFESLSVSSEIYSVDSKRR